VNAVGRRVVVFFCAGLIALAAAGHASAFSKQDLKLRMDDGVELAATLYEPSTPPPLEGYPAIVLLHGLGGNRHQLDPLAEHWANTFAVLSFDARGHGQSGGLVSIDGPREIKDTRAVYDWLSLRLEIDQSHIGAWGISLGGGAVLRSLVEGVPWTAVEVAQTWTDLYSALAPQSLAKSGAIFQFLNSVPQNRLDPSVLAIKDDALASRNLSVLRAFGAQRSTRALLSKVRTPVYFFQGRRDFAFDIAQATAGYRLVKGPKSLYIGDFGHAPSTFPGPDFAQVLAESTRWFSMYLLGVVSVASPLLLAPDPWRGKPVTYRTLPPTRRLRFGFGRRNTLTGVGKAVRTSGRLRTRIETFGSAEVRVTARLSGGWSRVVAVLTAKAPRGKTFVVSEGGVNTAGLRGRHRLAIRLINDATLIPRRAKLTLTLASSSMAQDPSNLLYLDLPMPAKAKVSLGPAQLILPVLRIPVSR
jgi:predicted acyl esterase